MQQRAGKMNGLRTAGLLALALGILLCFTRNAIDSNNVNYAVEQLHQYDSALYPDNPSLTGEGISPRFFMNWLTSLMMRTLRMPWEGVTLFFIYLCVAVTGVAIVHAVLQLTSKNRAACVALLSLFVGLGITSGFPGWSTFEPGTVGMGTGFAFSMLALSFAVGEPKRWNAAWGIQALAMLLHVHEGIWGFTALMLLWTIECVNRRRIVWKTLRTLVVYLAVAALCILPGLKASPSTLTDAQFANLYAFERTPHHLWPTSWGWTTILQYFLLLVYPGLFRLQSIGADRAERKAFTVEFSLSLFAWCVALTFTYLFAEVWPSATLITLYASKFLRYVSLLAMFWYLRTLMTHWENGRWETALSVAAFALAAQAAGIWLSLLLFAAVWLTTWQARRWKRTAARLALGLLSLGLLGCWALTAAPRIGLLLLLVALLPLLNGLWAKIKAPQTLRVAAGALLTLVILLYGAYGVVYTAQNRALALRSGHDFLVAGASEEIDRLANDFQAQTAKDSVFLARPTIDASNWFQLISRRSCYVLWKTVPASKAGIEEWYRRYLRVKDLASMTAEETASLMREIGVPYLLVSSSQNGEYATNADFSLFMRSNHYFVYRLNAV
ncbi:MAG TPA: hypothetical protein PLP25_03035 [Candidatus Limiplasma sp.]|nr:hypothetical protein [Candidatus Limiplasma sp.]HPS80823.1 hypothetical protein [Candidatus Limiplasma sp.]